MENDNGLELSLGLSCGRSSGKTKDNNGGSASDSHKAEGDDRSSKVINDFKSFLQPTTQRQESAKSPQNFFNDLSKAPTTDADASTKPFWTEGETGNKRKYLFREIDSEKKNKDSHVDLHEKKTKPTHVSITTDEGSTADNEDVAESEMGDVDPTADTKARKSHGSSTADHNTNHSGPFSVNPFNATSSQSPLQAKDSDNGAINLPIMFGYSSVQIPTLDKDSPGSFLFHSHHLNPSRATLISAVEEGGTNGDSTCVSFDFSAIKPGMAADVKFGGVGLCPNLPWVSTTGSGPHGRTISGVTYRYSTNQIRIVCACHGTHMSPEEFVRHANEECVGPESSVGLTAASALS